MSPLAVFLHEFVACAAFVAALALSVWGLYRAPGLRRW